VNLGDAPFFVALALVLAGSWVATVRQRRRAPTASEQPAAVDEVAVATADV
jgi:hypothetical protein